MRAPGNEVGLFYNFVLHLLCRLMYGLSSLKTNMQKASENRMDSQGLYPGELNFFCLHGSSTDIETVRIQR